MKAEIQEIKYPINFRKEDSDILGGHIKSLHSVQLIGMVRVGISNFLRFFINHPQIHETYIESEAKKVFITVDLQDLIEREVFPFWRLTFKRVVDSIQSLDSVNGMKDKASTLFLNSIQTGDLFMTIEGLRESLGLITSEGYEPVIFFIRFDRLQDVVTKEFFDNLQSLRESSLNKLSFVFTSHRSLHDLAPKVFEKADLSVFAHEQYLKPGKTKDMESILETMLQQYDFTLEKDIKEKILELAGGHVQYLQLSVIIINELINSKEKITVSNISEELTQDERIELQSEELLNNLNAKEKSVLMLIHKGSKLSEEEKQTAIYLWDSGILNGKNQVFSKFFEDYLDKQITDGKKNEETHFTKKEHLLYKLLEDNLGEICERETVVATVWPEYSNYGVSDWSIDRLVSRLRKKMELNKSPYLIETIRTRGFKLVEK